MSSRRSRLSDKAAASLVAALDEISGCLGENEKTQCQDAGPRQLQAHGNAVGC